tara:strand:- start:4699 stop:6909 length:2211 start_codon:yes stop_codon:yes gene_type:complete
MPLSEQIANSIHTLHQQAQQSFHRRLLVLSGSENWCFRYVDVYLAQICNKEALLISDKAPLLGLSPVKASKLSQQLGSEYRTLIWDGFSGLNPDGLGIASGLLRGGGLFIFLLPSLESLQTQADIDYLRMCSERDDLASFHTFFLRRLVNQIKNSDGLLLIEEGKVPQPISDITSNTLNEVGKLPTSDQLSAINAIKKVAFGHRHRPLVIKANRGRGKSSAIGFAAAEIYIETQNKMLITAPSKLTCEAAFKHYKTTIERHFTSPEDIETALNAFEFIALDSITTELKNCHLLFIDEAAAIPVSALNLLLNHYSRIIFSTTIHGYEGNGQGFVIRFQKNLDSMRPQWKSISLSSPIRWAENDPLEAWFFKFLLLNAKLAEIKTTASQPIQTTWIDQAMLSQNEALLEQVIFLLVSAHYQTRPSDLRLILDHPKINILIAHTLSSDKEQITLANLAHEEILGVCLIIEEGGFKSAQLAEDIISGKRRPRGQLFPQALCSSSAKPEFLEQTCYRIMRIAVHPTRQHKGIGSTLLTSVAKFARANHIDSLTSSYGLSPELLSFWHKNSFSIVKLGLKVDGASGLQSIMMMHPLSARANDLLSECATQFSVAFIFNLNRQHQHLSINIVTSIFQTLSANKLKRHPLNNKKIDAFAKSLRPYEESDVDIFNFVLSKIMTSTWVELCLEHQAILIIKVLQNKDQDFCLKYLNLTGKKQLDLALRKAVGALLELDRNELDTET